MIIKVLLTVIFLVVMVGVGGRSPSEPLISPPWSSSATPDSSDGSTVCRVPGSVSAMPLSAPSWHGSSWVVAQN